MSDVTLVVVAGTTETAAIDGISAAGADPELRTHTPSADLEIVADGRPAPDSPVPVSPSGCPTPAVITRAVRERVGFDVVGVDAGLAVPTDAPVRGVGASPGGDVRDPEPVPDAAAVFENARETAPEIVADEDGPGASDELLVAETIPGGTTTALGVLTALGEADVLGTSGEAGAVSSSLPENPLGLKREVVAESLAASGLSPGEAAGEPTVALRRAGDPALAVVAGLAAGALETDTAVTLAGGTQQLAVAALVRHGGYEGRLGLATTSCFSSRRDRASRRGVALIPCSRDRTETRIGAPGGRVPFRIEPFRTL